MQGFSEVADVIKASGAQVSVGMGKNADFTAVASRAAAPRGGSNHAVSLTQDDIVVTQAAWTNSTTGDFASEARVCLTPTACLL